MDSDGLNSTPLVTVTEVDIYKQNVVAGVFSNVSTCGTSGTTLCENIYNAAGVLQNGVSGSRSGSQHTQRRQFAGLREAGHQVQLHTADR